MNEILLLTILALFDGAIGILLKERWQIFVFLQYTEQVSRARNLLITQIKSGARRIGIALALSPFLKNRMQALANRISGLA